MGKESRPNPRTLQCLLLLAELVCLLPGNSILRDEVHWLLREEGWDKDAPAPGRVGTVLPCSDTGM